MGDKRNIAKELRFVNSVWFFGNRTFLYKDDSENKEMSNMIEAASNSEIVYPGNSSIIDKEQGSWQIRDRFGFKIPFLIDKKQEGSHGFCAVYKKKGLISDEEVRTVVLGEFPPGGYRISDSFVEKNLEVITKNVLEQRKWFAWPPRKLVEDNPDNYGLGVGIKTGIATTLALPFYDILANSKSLDYMHLFEKLKEWNSPNIVGLMFAGMFGSLILGGLTSTLFESFRVGEKADKKRVKELHEFAKENWKYGGAAAKALKEEKDLFLNEEKKTKLYKKSQEEGVDIDKESFEQIYDAFITMDRQKFRLLYRATFPGKDNLEKLVHIIAKDITPDPTSPQNLYKSDSGHIDNV